MRLAGYRLIAALGSTLRWRTEGLEHLEAHRAQRPAAGHGVLARPDPAGHLLLPPPRHRRHHQRELRRRVDRRIIERFGYGTARGSTSRGARKALLQLTREMAAGRPAGFTVDGPRGPARVAQPGAVWLAQATGNPVLPFHLEADRALDAAKLGPDADSQAVRHGGAGRRRAVRRAGGARTRRRSSGRARRLEERLWRSKRARRRCSDSRLARLPPIPTGLQARGIRHRDHEVPHASAS